MAAPLDGFSQLEPGAPTEVGRYRLYARLGAGGMGQVFLSFLPGGRPIALKVVRAEFSADPEFRRRFAQEARAAQQVNGIHIAQLLDADPEAATPWLATAYIPGPSLLEAVRLHGPLPVASVRRLIAGIAQALDAIHAAGLIHRDLKPANVILAADGPRVIDFGIARALETSMLTQTGLAGRRRRGGGRGSGCHGPCPDRERRSPAPGRRGDRGPGGDRKQRSARHTDLER